MFASPLKSDLKNRVLLKIQSSRFYRMADNSHIDKWFERIEMYQNNCIPVVNVINSDYEQTGRLKLKRRQVKRNLHELQFNLRRRAPVMSQMEQVNPTPNDINVGPIKTLRSSRDAAPAATSNPIPANTSQAPVGCHTNFYNWLIQTVILDDLSFREPFINPAVDANRMTEEELMLHGINLYYNARMLSPQELVNLPFIPRQMVTGTTMMDLPFLDPLLVVLWDFHLEDVHWMLNVLPWRVVDRPVRTGRSILAWIVEIGNVHKFLETTRAPLSTSMKIIRFLDNYFE